MTHDHIIAVAIGAVALTLTYVGCYHNLNIPKRASIVIAFCFGVITYYFLLENPAVLVNTQTRTALALLAAVVGVAYAIRRLFS